MQTIPKTKSEIRYMRESGHMLASVLQKLIDSLEVGMTTKDIAVMARNELQVLGGEPSFLGYQGFPDVICISLNNQVVHGIPNSHSIVKSGDIVSLDFGVTYGGMVTDAARSVIVGKPLSIKHQDLLKYTEKSLYDAIGIVKSGIRTGDIGYTVEQELNKHHYGIVRDLVGHGVGHQLHEDPNIPNYGRKNTGPWLAKNMTIAIEPMSTLGTDRVVLSEDGWTILTADNSWSAHFEHTILINSEGSEILTDYKD